MGSFSELAARLERRVEAGEITIVDDDQVGSSTCVDCDRDLVSGFCPHCDWCLSAEQAKVPRKFRRDQVRDFAPLRPGLHEEWEGDPWCVVIYGVPGCGKTTEGTKLLMKWALRRQWALWKDAQMAMYETMQEIGDGGKSFDAMLRCGCLLLDDIGAERGTDFNSDKLSLVLRHRYNEMLPTIVTTNAKSLRELAGETKQSDAVVTKLRPQIVSRLGEGRQVKLEDRDLRPRRGAE